MIILLKILRTLKTFVQKKAFINNFEKNDKKLSIECLWQASSIIAPREQQLLAHYLRLSARLPAPDDSLDHAYTNSPSSLFLSLLRAPDVLNTRPRDGGETSQHNSIAHGSWSSASDMRKIRWVNKSPFSCDSPSLSISLHRSLSLRISLSYLLYLLLPT